MKRNKYNAVKTQVDGITFDSHAEARRYQQLKALKESGQITELVLQQKFPLHVNGQKVSTYIADFTYKNDGGLLIVEDAKGFKTPVYQLKKKMMFAEYGIVISEVYNTARHGSGKSQPTCSHGSVYGACAEPMCIHHGAD